MKKLLHIFLLIIFIFNIFIFDTSLVNAQSITATIIDLEGVNVRAGAGVEHSVSGVLSYAATVNLVSTTLHPGSGCDAGWYQINYKGSTNRYICSELAKVNQTSSSELYYTTSVWGYRINENYATVRKTASFNAERLDTIYLGTDVNIIGEAGKSSGCDTGWYLVSYYSDTKKGYVCKRLVDKYENLIGDDEEYCNYLMEQGFPKSYCPYLTKLHMDHPTWIFTPIITNINFDDAVMAEAGKNYIQSTVPAYITSNIPQESGTWYIASNPVVAYYLDARNYLNEKNIFSFEVLDYDQNTHTADVLKSMFGLSYLANDEYVGYFLEAANDFGVSPIHLASRVIQEGGSDESYDGVSGISALTYAGKSLVGVYNYYNIGAYQDNVTTSSVARGLAVAAGYIDQGSYANIPWKTRKDAIYYGAQFIAGGYVNDGQNTAYFQKFNTSPTSSRPSFTHQYMTNIIAPASEALSTYSTYKSEGLLETAFTFAIPVYNNMPTDFTSHPYFGDTNNDLSDIKINDISIPGFDSDVLTYTSYIEHDTTSINISATSSSNKSYITGIGNIAITKDTTEITIVVTSEVGTSKKYIVTLIKKEPPVIEQPEVEKATIDEIINKIDVKCNDTYLTGIQEGMSVSTLANMFIKEEPSIVITILDANNKPAKDILKTGDIINIDTGNEQRTLIIVIKGDNNGDGKISSIDMLRVQKHILKYSQLTGAYKEASDTNYDDNISGVDMLRIQKHILKYIILK